MSLSRLLQNGFYLLYLKKTHSSIGFFWQKLLCLSYYYHPNTHQLRLLERGGTECVESSFHLLRDKRGMLIFRTLVFYGFTFILAPGVIIIINRGRPNEGEVKSSCIWHITFKDQHFWVSITKCYLTWTTLAKVETIPKL